MGCDISIEVETLTGGTMGYDSSLRWEHYGSIECHRDYELFSKMCGHGRGNAIPIATTRGFPDDVNNLTQIILLNKEEYGWSYLDGNELKKLKKWCKKTDCFVGLEMLASLEELVFYGYTNKKHIYNENLRIVFGFDS